MSSEPLTTRRFARPPVMDADGRAEVTDMLAARRRRLGTALHELATELAQERRRNAMLERENRRLRELLDQAVAQEA